MENLVFTFVFGRPLWRASVAKFIREITDVMNREEEETAVKEHRKSIVIDHFCPMDAPHICDKGIGEEDSA